MGRKQFRVGAWLLALFTSFMLAGNTAYAWEHENQPRVQVGGWFNSFQTNQANPTALPPPSGAKISMSITGRCEDGATTCQAGTWGHRALGNYEFFDHFTGIRSHGKVTNLQFTVSGACGEAPPGKPMAIVDGQGNDGSQFHAEVTDADDSTPPGPDTVCYWYVMNGNTKGQLIPGGATETDGGNAMQHGNIEVRNYNGTNH